MEKEEREPGSGKEPKLICGRCKVPLQIEKVMMKYLNHQVKGDFPKCPICGQVYIPEKTVNEKIKEVEAALEDK